MPTRSPGRCSRAAPVAARSTTSCARTFQHPTPRRAASPAKATRTVDEECGMPDGWPDSWIVPENRALARRPQILGLPLGYAALLIMACLFLGLTLKYVGAALY